MQIPERTWRAYTQKLAKINQKAASLMAEYLNAHGAGDMFKVIDYAYGLSGKYGEAAAELACQMYDALAVAQKAGVAAAEPAEPASYDAVSRTVQKTAGNADVAASAVGRMVKQAGADTILKNALRDGAEFAWIPSGDACAFCATLASRGWQRASKKTIKGGHAEHIHNNCQCEFAVRFDGKSDVEGYDPDKLYEEYIHADDGSPQDKINAMRRKRYAVNKDQINAQKRAAYAKKAKRSLPDQLGFSYNGYTEFIPKGTTIENTKTIAGRGSQDILRDKKRLANVYGGKEEDWSKRVGKVSSDKYEFDVHWYEQLDGNITEAKIANIKEKKK